MASIIIYGIPNCDTIKKTLDWFKQHKKAILFHDYKKDGISKKQLTEWCKLVSWEILLNKKSTTWRSLSNEVQESITNQNAAIKIMMENTSLIKRPVIEYQNKVLVGFDEKKLQETFG